MTKTSLVIMAAGIGSRYGGGIKQMDPLGPAGEIMLDYSAYDAIEAGFDRIIFVIRKDIGEEFRSLIGGRIGRFAEVCYAFQELDDLPEGFSVPEGRVKPWGTGQALLAAEDLISGPFAVVNADDDYGKAGFAALHRFLTEEASAESGKELIAMTAFTLVNTLSENGGVTRGILDIGEDGRLRGISETRNLIRTDEGPAVMTDGGLLHIAPETPVSMNMWGFRPSFIGCLRERFPIFLESLGENALTAEFLLPEIVGEMTGKGEAEVRIVRSPDTWFGVTYAEDREYVRGRFRELAEQGVYRTPLFEEGPAGEE